MVTTVLDRACNVQGSTPLCLYYHLMMLRGV